MKQLAIGLLLGVSTVVAACGPTPAQEPENNAVCRAERDTIETAVEAWRAEHGAYPERIEQLVGVLLGAAPTLEWSYVVDGDTFTLSGSC